LECFPPLAGVEAVQFFLELVNGRHYQSKKV
jgi:hypothetical protein